MRVRRSDVIAFRSIQRDRCVTGANAMASSVAGSEPGSVGVRMNASRAGPWGSGPSAGFQRDAGASVGSSATLRGPVRRSSIDAIEERHDLAAISRSAGLIVTCTSFSASANVAGETAGPVRGAVPKVGGAPGGGADGAGVLRRRAPVACTSVSAGTEVPAPHLYDWPADTGQRD